MEKKIKRYITVILSIILIGVSIPVTKVEAATNHLIIINTKTNKLGYFVNNKLVKTFPVATGKASTPTPTGKSKIDHTTQGEYLVEVLEIHLEIDG